MVKPLAIVTEFLLVSLVFGNSTQLESSLWVLMKVLSDPLGYGLCILAGEPYGDGTTLFTKMRNKTESSSQILAVTLDGYSESFQSAWKIIRRLSDESALIPELFCFPRGLGD